MVKWCKICFVRTPIPLKLCLNNSYLIIQALLAIKLSLNGYVCVYLLTGLKSTCVKRIKILIRVTLLDIENLVTKICVQFQLKSALKNTKELRNTWKTCPLLRGQQKWSVEFFRKISGINVKEYANLASSTPVSLFQFFLYCWANVISNSWAINLSICFSW